MSYRVVDSNKVSLDLFGKHHRKYMMVRDDLTINV